MTAIPIPILPAALEETAADFQQLVGLFATKVQSASDAVNASVQTVGRNHGVADIALHEVAEAPWSEAEWAVAPRFDNPRATVLVLVLG